MTDTMSSEGTLAADEGVKKARSPAYPAIDLQAAVGLVEKLFKAANRQAVIFATAMDAMGLKAKSSSGQTAISALRKFGLIVDLPADAAAGSNRTIRVSERAHRLLRSADSGERASLLREAALLPKIHKEIVEQFPGDLPDDKVIGSWLELERKFYFKAVPDVVRVFRSSIAFAGIGGSGNVGDPHGDAPSDADNREGAMPTALPAAAQLSGPDVPLPRPPRNTAPAANSSSIEAVHSESGVKVILILPPAPGMKAMRFTMDVGEALKKLGVELPE